MKDGITYKPIQKQFRIARTECCGRPATLFASAAELTMRKVSTRMPAPSKGQNFVKSSAQVETSVGQNVLQKSCELRSSKKKEKNKEPKYPPPLRVRYRTYEEREKVIKAAKEAGIGSVSGYLRAVSLGSDYKPPANPELLKALLAANKELTAQGRNLNQIAKHLNQGTASKEQGGGLLAILARSLLRAHQAIRKALAGGKESEP